MLSWADYIRILIPDIVDLGRKYIRKTAYFRYHWNFLLLGRSFLSSTGVECVPGSCFLLSGLILLPNYLIIGILLPCLQTQKIPEFFFKCKRRKIEKGENIDASKTILLALPDSCLKDFNQRFTNETVGTVGYIPFLYEINELLGIYRHFCRYLPFVWIMSKMLQITVSKKVYFLKSWSVIIVPALPILFHLMVDVGNVKWTVWSFLYNSNFG